MSSSNPDITGIILVGGLSRRMGTDKAFLDLNGRPLIERALEVCREVCGTVLLVGNRPERFGAYGLPMVADIYPGSSLGGLYTGLSHATTPAIFAIPCDIPFPNAAIMQYLISRRDDYDAVVPLTAHGVEPLFAVYTKACLEPMRQMLETGNVRINDLYSHVRTRYVEKTELTTLDPSGTAFLNLNTPDDYERARGKE